MNDFDQRFPTIRSRSGPAARPSGPPVEIPRLGVSSVIRETFALFFKRFVLFFLLALLPSLALTALSVVLMPLLVTEESILSLWPWLRLAVFGGLMLSITLIMMGSISLAVYDVKMGRPIKLFSYLFNAMLAIPEILVLGVLLSLMFALMAGAFILFASIVTTTALPLGLILLFAAPLPWFYVTARYMVFVPAVLVEGAGFRGLGRAATLSENYRWSIAGATFSLLVLTVLIALVINLPFLAAIGFDFIVLPGVPIFTISSVLQSLASAVQFALLSIFVALLYVRLREIKEGLGAEDISEVFR